MDCFKSLALWPFLIVLTCMGLSHGALAQTVRVTGEVTYRERIALPANAQLAVTLVDVTDEAARPLVEAVAPIARRGQIPLQFILDVQDGVIRPGRSYALMAEITSGGRLWFRNSLPQPLDPLSAQSQLLLVSFAGQIIGAADKSAPATGTNKSAQLQVSSGLTDTLWVGSRIDGKPALASARTTLSIAADRRAGGTAACNSYFAEALFDGPELRFSSIVATRRACAPALIEEEGRFFSSLAAVRGYRLEGRDLSLLNGQGTQVLRFRLAR